MKIDNKIKQNKAKYDLHRKTAKILALSSGYGFWIDKDIVPEKRLLQKDATIKWDEYSALSKAQIDIAKDQYKFQYK